MMMSDTHVIRIMIFTFFMVIFREEKGLMMLISLSVVMIMSISTLISLEIVAITPRKLQRELPRQELEFSIYTPL